MEKKCAKCGDIKNLDCFYKRKPKGYRSYCKECMNNEARKVYQKDPEKNIKASLEWRKRNRERYLKNLRRHNATPERVEKRKQWGKSNGAKLAVRKVYYAVQIGVLTNLKEVYVKCTDCNNRANQYDHRDYNKPLNVEPVCASCNRKRGPAIPAY